MKIDIAKITAFFSRRSVSYVSIVVGLGVVLFLIVAGVGWQNKETATKLTKEFELESKDLECKVVADTSTRDFINAQRREIVAYGNSHLRTAKTFYGYFWASYAVFSVFGLIAAISLAVMTKKGIEAADNRIIAVFLISTGIVILYQGFFGVFQHKNNIDNNVKLSINYSKLVNQIDAYCATGRVNVKDPILAFADALPKTTPKTAPTTTTGNTDQGQTETPPSGKVSPFYVPLEPVEFIHYIEWHLEQYKVIAISIDDTKIASIDNGKMALP